MWRKRPRAGDVDVSASKVSLLEVPAMAISSATPGSGCGKDLLAVALDIDQAPKESVEVS